jgi:hypothetical protein
MLVLLAVDLGPPEMFLNSDYFFQIQPNLGLPAKVFFFGGGGGLKSRNF